MIRELERTILVVARELFQDCPEQTFCQEFLKARLNNALRSLSREQVNDKDFEKAFDSLVKKGLFVEKHEHRFHLRGV